MNSATMINTFKNDNNNIAKTEYHQIMTAITEKC